MRRLSVKLAEDALEDLDELGDSTRGACTRHAIARAALLLGLRHLQGADPGDVAEFVAATDRRRRPR